MFSGVRVDSCAWASGVILTANSMPVLACGSRTRHVVPWRFRQPQHSRNRFPIPNLARENHLDYLRKRQQFAFDGFVLLGLRWTWRQSAGEVHRHGLVQEAGARIEEQRALPVLCAISRLLQQFALGAGERRLSRINSSRRYLPQIIFGGISILALQ